MKKNRNLHTFRNKTFMFKPLIQISIFLLYLSCNNKVYEVPKNSKIITKFKVLDEIRSPLNINCSEKSVPFLKMRKYDCSFSVGNYEFDIEKKYLVDNKGNLLEFSTYLSEGPLTYSIKELDNDVKFKKYENLENFYVKISKNGKEIIDGNKIMKIKEVFENEKLILIEKEEMPQMKGRRIIYEYK